MNGFVEDLDSEALHKRIMTWMEELCHASLSIMYLIDQFMKGQTRRKGSWVRPLRRNVLGFTNLISQHKVARKMDYIYAKIHDSPLRGQREFMAQ